MPDIITTERKLGFHIFNYYPWQEHLTSTVGMFGITALWNARLSHPNQKKLQESQSHYRKPPLRKQGIRAETIITAGFSNLSSSLNIERTPETLPCPMNISILWIYKGRFKSLGDSPLSLWITNAICTNHHQHHHTPLLSVIVRAERSYHGKHSTNTFQPFNEEPLQMWQWWK